MEVRLLPVRSQCSQTGKGVARLLDRGAGHLIPLPITPKPDKSLKHYVLRILLWRSDYAPLNYIRFLDYAAERVFLRKVGGGYIFTHRLLMEYFATL